MNVKLLLIALLVLSVALVGCSSDVESTDSPAGDQIAGSDVVVEPDVEEAVDDLFIDESDDVVIGDII